MLTLAVKETPNTKVLREKSRLSKLFLSFTHMAFWGQKVMETIEKIVRKILYI